MSDANSLLILEDVSKTLGGQPVLRGLDLRVRRGETYVLLGRSGSGKSLTLKHLVGLVTPDSGRVFVDGHDLAALDREGLQALRRRFGLLFQSGALINWMSVEDNVALPLREHSRLRPEEIGTRVEECLSLVHLTGHGAKMPDELSGGMRKRAGLARAVALRPEILLYDEPTAGLDPIMAAAITELLAETKERTGSTAVVVTHSLPCAFRVADRMGLLHEGRILVQGAPDEFRASTEPAVVEFLSGIED
jgi:phospholipid/cholesterol/gamma-HCH transport system ATP-binding protein